MVKYWVKRIVFLAVSIFCGVWTVAWAAFVLMVLSDWKLGGGWFSFVLGFALFAGGGWVTRKSWQLYKMEGAKQKEADQAAGIIRKKMSPETKYKIKIGVSAAAVVAGIAMMASSDDDLFEAGAPLLMFGLIFMFAFWRSHKKKTVQAQKDASEAALQARIAEVGAMTELPVLEPYAIVTHPGELCHYQAAASVLVIKNQVVGRTGGSGGVSVRVAKGLTLHSGRGASQSIRKDVAYTYPGILTITNQRMIMTGEKGFEYPLLKITSMVPYNRYDGITLQFGRSTFTLLLDEPFVIPKILELIGAQSAVQN